MQAAWAAFANAWKIARYAGLGLPYKQRVGGSNPSTPTSFKVFGNQAFKGLIAFFYRPEIPEKTQIYSVILRL